MTPLARSTGGLLRRCLAPGGPRPAAASVAGPCRRMHRSAPCCQRPPRSRFRNVKAQELGLLDEAELKRYRERKFPDYSPEEMQELEKKYNPKQLEALQAGEQAVRPEDMILQGRLRDDPYRPNYVEDYTRLDPSFDVRPELETKPQEPQWPSLDEWVDQLGAKMTRLTEKRTSDQLRRAMARALRRIKESDGEELIDLTVDELREMEDDPELLSKYIVRNADGEPEPAQEGDGQESDGAPGSAYLTRAQIIKLDERFEAEWKKELEAVSGQKGAGDAAPTTFELLADGPAGLDRLYSAEAPELGKVPGVEGLYKTAADPEDGGQDDSGQYQEIKRLTGMRLRDIQSLYRKVLVTRWVSNQTRLGKVRSTSVVAIAGNGNGRLGLGIAKSTEPRLAAETAQLLAIRNMKPIRRYERRTIYGDVKAKVSGTVVELFSRPPGTFFFSFFFGIISIPPVFPSTFIPLTFRCVPRKRRKEKDV